MDLTYLLWLQDLREATGNILTPFMDAVSYIAVRIIILVPFFVYWCVSKRDGMFMILSCRISSFINQISKLAVCAYRPWIRDARIIPANNAIASAGGYSFPSGHTMDSAPVYAGLAVLTRKRAKWFAYLCGIMIVLTALSRNYLGVHTPQDVVVGSILGIFSVYIAARIMAHPEKENMYMLCGILITIAGLLYVMMKSYPMDYADGKLLVNPAKMTPYGYGTCGAMLAMITGRYIEKNCVKFTETGLTVKGVILSLLGIAIYGYGLAYLKAEMPKHLGADWGRFAAEGIPMFFAVTLWPIVLKVFVGRK